MSKTLSAITRWVPIVVKFLITTDDFQVPARPVRRQRPRRSLNG